MTFTVVRGYRTESESAAKGEVCIYTLDGEKLFVREEYIDRVFENEAPKAKSPALSTFFIRSDATVRIEVRLNEGGGGPDPRTIYKYLDDGGTPSKSRDDGYQPMTPAKYIDDGNTVRKSLDDF